MSTFFLSHFHPRERPDSLAQQVLTELQDPRVQRETRELMEHMEIQEHL